jgi:hypothetical protein
VEEILHVTDAMKLAICHESAPTMKEVVIAEVEAAAAVEVVATVEVEEVAVEAAVEDILEAAAAVQVVTPATTVARVDTCPEIVPTH